MSINLKQARSQGLKQLGVLVLAVWGLSAFGIANAQAASFTASATGTLSGEALSTHVITVNGGQIRCTKAVVTGVINSTASSEQHTTVDYSNCTAFGFANVHMTPVTFRYTANGEVHLQNTVTVNVTIGACHVTVGPQTLKSVSFSTNGSGVRITHNVSGIVYSASGGLCGSGGANGTFTGVSQVNRSGGGSISFDP